MKYLIRDVSKVILFAILWWIPVELIEAFNNLSLLWLFLGSAVLTGLMFSHYEDLEKIDQWPNVLKDKEEPNNE